MNGNAAFILAPGDGGGGSGTSNYNDLSNRPKINDTILSGNKSASDLGLVSDEDAVINNSITMGSRATDSTTGEESVAVGTNITASSQIAIGLGFNAQATQMYATAIGNSVVSSANFAIAEGQGTTASNIAAHAQGNNTTASGPFSHAEGNSTVASGNSSHAEGYGTKATVNYQHVEGVCNIEDTENKYVHIVGNGNPTTASNAHTLDFDGNAWFAGDVENGTGDKLSEKADSSDVYSKSDVDDLLDDKADASDVYTKTEVGDLLDDKANTSDVYTKTEVDNLLDDKVDKDVVTLTDFASLKEGLNAVLIPSGTTLGSFTVPNNIRGYFVKNGTTGNGIFSDYNDNHRYYIIYSDALSVPGWRVSSMMDVLQEPTVTWENCTPLAEGTFFQAKNGVAYLSAHLNNVTIAANTWKSFGTIPEGFRPNKADIRFPVLIDGTTKACKGHITSTGVIGIYSSEAITESSSAFVFNLSYIIS